jgi:hypothetical protein
MANWTDMTALRLLTPKFLTQMMRVAALTAGMALGLPCYGQLTAEQKKADFRELVSRFAKNYAPNEWKKEAVGFDGYAIGEWLERAAATETDLAYFDLCVEYVSSYFDAHSVFRLPATFSATLGFGVDIYDGRVLIDTIDTARLPAEVFPAKVGDELVSVDGTPMEEWITRLKRYAIGGNPDANRRDAAALALARSQATNPFAHQIGETAEVVIRNAEGEERTVTLPWRKTGIAVEQIAPPPPVTMAATVNRGMDDADPSAYRGYLERKANLRMDTRGRTMVQGFGAKLPVFALPENMVTIAGAGSFDTAYAGLIPYGERTVGYLRLGRFAGSSGMRVVREALARFRNEADVVVLDVTRNVGGSACMMEDVAAEFMREDWKVQGAEQMVSWRDILSLQAALETARLFEDWESVALLEHDLWAYEEAFREGRVRTHPIPLCGTTIDKAPLRHEDGSPRGIDKPLLVLIDEFSASAAEHLAAVLQDNGRAKLFGKRTTGAGGAVFSLPAGVYSEGTTSVTWTLTNRSKNVATGEYREAPYIENIGVRPDIEFEMNTAENLKNNGRDYVKAFLDAALGLLP